MGPIRLAPITVFFGANSSGKSSLLKLLLLFKQTVESQDRKRVLEFGDYSSYRTYADIGSYHDVVYGHNSKLPIEIGFAWNLASPLIVENPKTKTKALFFTNSLDYSARFEDRNDSTYVKTFKYQFGSYEFGMEANDPGFSKYKLLLGKYITKQSPGRPWPSPAPIKCYGFPAAAIHSYQDVDFLTDFPLRLEQLFNEMAYLGPMRDEPTRTYVWPGDRPTSVGVRGENTVSVLLAADADKVMVSAGRGRAKRSLNETIQFWLRRMGLLESFSIEAIGQHRKEYELSIKTTQGLPFANIADVGFGISQVLPIIVACYHAPKNTTIIIEQPENHLHPRAQSALADLFIAAAKDLRIQVIVESHSEHFLRRLQRRIAEAKINSKDTALYFCERGETASRIDELRLDSSGRISNWPDKFFGDGLEEITAMNKASLRRKSG
jgi:predicted ATPase